MFITSLNVAKNRILNCLNPSKGTANILSQVTIYPLIPHYMCVTPPNTHICMYTFTFYLHCCLKEEYCILNLHRTY